MKKFLLYFCGFTIVFFIAPAICTATPKKNNQQEQPQNENNKQLQEQSQEQLQTMESTEENTQEQQENRTIRLLHATTGEIEEVNLDEYLYGVVSAEMPANYETEALKAQAVVARTYTIYQMRHNSNKHENADICDNYACCQAWISKEDRISKWNGEEAESNWNKIEEAVNSTTGKIVTYNGEPINAFFHSNSGGITEVPVNVWGGTGYPYLQSVETSGENTYTQYASEVTLSQEELINKLKEKYSDISIDFTNSEDIKILEYTESTRVKTVKFGNHEISGVEARTLFGLKSTNFDITRDGDNIKFSVKGYGHGVGMSQTGADSMAKQGSSSEDIIKHFYTGVEITEVNKL